LREKEGTPGASLRIFIATALGYMIALVQLPDGASLERTQKTQADSQFRLRPEDVEHLSVRNKHGDMIPLGTLVKLTPMVGSSLISLSNLRPSATVMACRRTDSRPAIGLVLLMALSAKNAILIVGLARDLRAEARMTVFAGMIASTGLAMLFVPSFFVVVQRFEEWRNAGKQSVLAGKPAPAS
jgi:multidrug efflux pump subunit AcrB